MAGPELRVAEFLLKAGRYAPMVAPRVRAGVGLATAAGKAPVLPAL